MIQDSTKVSTLQCMQCNAAKELHLTLTACRDTLYTNKVKESLHDFGSDP